MLRESNCLAFIGCVRLNKPVVHCLTNYVSMDFMANALSAVGASPAMIHAEEEVKEFAETGNVLLVNTGTLSTEWLKSMISAILAYQEKKKPWVLDPVAAGATEFRLRANLELMEMEPAIVRGNASEIVALATENGNRAGVDSLISSETALEAGKFLAKQYGTVVAISGETDYITDGKTVFSTQNGNALLASISAAGCTVTALIAAYLAVAIEDTVEARLLAATFALSTFGLLAEDIVKSSGHSVGPAELRTRLVDSLCHVSLGHKTLAGFRFREVWKKEELEELAKKSCLGMMMPENMRSSQESNEAAAP